MECSVGAMHALAKHSLCRKGLRYCKIAPAENQRGSLCRIFVNATVWKDAAASPEPYEWRASSVRSATKKGALHAHIIALYDDWRRRAGIVCSQPESPCHAPMATLLPGS